MTMIRDDKDEDELGTGPVVYEGDDGEGDGSHDFGDEQVEAPASKYVSTVACRRCQ
jgi:hypothetical protein